MNNNEKFEGLVESFPAVMTTITILSDVSKHLPEERIIGAIQEVAALADASTPVPKEDAQEVLESFIRVMTQIHLLLVKPEGTVQ